MSVNQKSQTNLHFVCKFFYFSLTLRPHAYIMGLSISRSVHYGKKTSF